MTGRLLLLIDCWLAHFVSIVRIQVESYVDRHCIMRSRYGMIGWTRASASMSEWPWLLSDWVGAVRYIYPDLRTKDRMASSEASCVKEWFLLSVLPNLVVRSWAVDRREVFQSSAAGAGLSW